MPWIIPARDSGIPNFMIFDEVKDVIPAYSSLTMSMYNMAGSYWKDGFVQKFTRSFYDVDGNLWEDTGSYLRMKRNGEATYSFNWAYRVYDSTTAVFVGEASSVGQPRYLKQQSIVAGYGEDLSRWYWLSINQNLPTKSLAEFWADVNQDMPNSEYAVALQYYGNQDLPFVVIDGKNPTADIKPFKMTQSGGLITVSTISLEQLQSWCPSMYYEEPKISPIDPYNPGGSTEPETGPTIGEWSLPDDELALAGSGYNDIQSGLYRMYAMTPTQLSNFSAQLWNSNVLDVISRYFERPADMVLGLYSYPFEVQSEAETQISFNWLSEWSSIYVTGHPITAEIQRLSFGYVDVPRYSGTFYDFQPYTTIQLHLPYIGFVELKANEVVGKRLYVDYSISVYSGDFTAEISTTGDNALPIIGLYQGNIGRPLPLTQQDLFQLFKKGAEIALAGAVAGTSGIIALASEGAANKAGNEAVSYIERNQGTDAFLAESSMKVHEAVRDESLKTFKRSAAVAGANLMMSHGPGVQVMRSGAVDASSGRTSSQEAFIIMTVPHQNVSTKQGMLGYPTNLSGPLSSYSGYTEVREIRLNVPDATDSERAEIEEIVRGGIII